MHRYEPHAEGLEHTPGTQRSPEANVTVKAKALTSLMTNAGVEVDTKTHTHANRKMYSYF